MHAFVQVSTTVEKREDAEKLAALVVGKRLAACVQVLGPVKSTYWWQGKVEDAEEWLCLMKTRQDLYKPLEKAIKSIHSYDEPEIVALPILEGGEGYLRWIEKETSGGQ
ncbi:MAG: divalent-cation tolerance protein CutA [Desulfatiglandales bacterium]